MPRPLKLQLYLRRATRGLWGQRRLEVWEELEAHILQRSRAFSLAGQPEEEAIQRVLEELGTPWVVSRGMMRLYTLPVLLPMLLMLAASVIYFGSQSAVLTVRDGPSPVCTQACTTDPDWVWTELSGFKLVLEAQGVGWQGNTLLFPGDKPIELVQAYSRVVWKYNRPTFSRDSKTYWLTQSLVEAIAGRSTLPVSLSGWSKPVLQVGQVKIQLGHGELWIKRLYRNLLAARISKFNPDADIAGYPIYRYRFRVQAEPGSVYAVLSPSVRGYFRSQIGAVAGQHVEFNLPWRKVSFGRLEELNFNPPGHTAKVGLVKLTGQLNADTLYQVVWLPAQTGQ